MATAALFALVVLRPVPIWWAVVAVVTASVIALELVNSAIETLVDRLHPSIHPEIKALKDMLAGAVLVASIAAMCVVAALMVDRLPTIMMFLGITR